MCHGTIALLATVDETRTVEATARNRSTCATGAAAALASGATGAGTDGAVGGAVGDAICEGGSALLQAATATKEKRGDRSRASRHRLRARWSCVAVCVEPSWLQPGGANR